MKHRKKAWFRFYAELNDFLPADKRKRDFEFHFSGTPAVKDAIEALNVPHTEVDLILINGRSVRFDYHLQDGNRLSVYPQFELLDISEVTHLRPKPLRRPRFILDINLGKLARKLRLLGFDSLYSNQADDAEIIDTALARNRIILTRDIGLLKHSRVTHGYWVRSTQPQRQVAEVVQKFDLFNLIEPFSLCLDCNSPLEPVDKAAVYDQLPPKTRVWFDEFYRCLNCRKIYWKGSHYKKMLAFVNHIKNGAESE